MDDTAFLYLFDDPSKASDFSVPQIPGDPLLEELLVQFENTKNLLLSAIIEKKDQSTTTNSGNSNAINLLGETKLAEKKLQSLEQSVPQVFQGNATTTYQPPRYSPLGSSFDNRDIIGYAPMLVNPFSPDPEGTENLFDIDFSGFGIHSDSGKHSFDILS